MIEPLRYHIEKNPPHAIKKAVFCERCLNNKKRRHNPQLATKYCSQCLRFHYLCGACEDYLHSFVKTNDHVRLIVVIGPAVRKKIMKRGDAKSFPKLFDMVEVQFKTAVVKDGQVRHKEPVQLMSFPSGVSGTCVHVQILGDKKLPISDAHGTSDPFVCISYAGNKLGTTRTRPRTINPRWTNETYVIPTDDQACLGHHKKHSKQRELIKLEVFDRDYWNRNDFLGHVELTRQQLLRLADHSNCKPIRLNLTLREYHGCLGLRAGLSGDMFSLKMECAEDLDRMDAVGLSDPYCVLHFCGKAVGRTPRIDNTLNPVWRSGHVVTLPVSEVLREERRLRLLASHGLTPTGPTHREVLAKSYIFTVQMYDHNTFRADGLLGTVRINVEQLRKLCPELPVREQDIAKPVGGVNQRLRKSISLAAGSLSLSLLSRQSSHSSLGGGGSEYESGPTSSYESGRGFAEEEEGEEEMPQEGSGSLDTFDSSAKAGLHQEGDEGQRLEQGPVPVQEEQAPNNQESEADMGDDMGDDHGGSDDGSVYRRPSSPTFVVNPYDEVEENTFPSLQGHREGPAAAASSAAARGTYSPVPTEEENRRTGVHFEGVADEEYGEGYADEEFSEEGAEEHAERVRLDEEEAHNRDIYHTDERFFDDRKLERLASALDGGLMLDEEEDEYDHEYEGQQDEYEGQQDEYEGQQDEYEDQEEGGWGAEESAVFEEESERGSGPFNSESDESDGDESDGDESGGDESGGDESGGDESGGDESGSTENKTAPLSRSSSLAGGLKRLISRTLSRTFSRSNLQRKKEALALSVQGPRIQWGALKFYDVQKDADHNVTDVEGDDRGQLIVRLIKASRGHVIRGLDVGIPPRSNLRVTCKLVSINGGGGLKLWRQWLRLFRMLRRAARETRTNTKIMFASCFALMGLLREKYRLYKFPPEESDSEADESSSESASSVSSDSSVSSEDNFKNDPYLTKVDINDSNRALYAGAGVMWGYEPNKPKFQPYDPARREELRRHEERKRDRELRAAEKQQRRAARARRKWVKSRGFDSEDSEEEDGGMGAEGSLLSKSKGGSRSRMSSQASLGSGSEVAARSGGERSLSLSKRAGSKTGFSGGPGGSVSGSVSVSGRSGSSSLAPDDGGEDNSAASGISGLVSEESRGQPPKRKDE